MNPDTIRQTTGNLPVNHSFAISRPVLSVIPGATDSQMYERQKFLENQIKKQLWFKQIMSSRNKLLREEQTLLVDSSYYIKPRSEFYLVQSENLTHQLMLPFRKIEHPSTDWFTLLVIVSLVIFVSAKYSFGKYFLSLFQSIFNYPAASRLYREQNISLKQGSTWLEILFLLVFSLFAFQITEMSDMKFPFGDFLRFVFCFVLLGLYFFLKMGVYSLVGFVSESTTETNEFLFNMRNHNKILGILLLPVVGFSAWAPGSLPSYAIMTGVVFIVILYLMTLVRGMKILLKKQFSIFYLFLYLCTLEFLPLAAFFKVI